MSVFGSRIHAVSGGYVGNGGMNVSGTIAPVRRLSSGERAAKSHDVRLVEAAQHRMTCACRCRLVAGLRAVARARAARAGAAGTCGRSGSVRTRRRPLTSALGPRASGARRIADQVAAEQIGEREVRCADRPIRRTGRSDPVARSEPPPLDETPDATPPARRTARRRSAGSGALSPRWLLLDIVDVDGR